MLNIMKCRGLNKIDFNNFNIIELQCIKDCIKQSSGIIMGIPSCKIMVALKENKFIFKTEGYNRTLQEYEKIYFDNVKDESNGNKNKLYDVCIKMCLRAYVEECNLFFFTTVDELLKFYDKFDVIPDTEQLKDDKAAMLEVIYIPNDKFTNIQFERFLDKHKLDIEEYSKITVHKKTIYIKNGTLLAPINSLIEFIESQKGEIIDAECGLQRVHIVRFDSSKFSPLKLIK